MMAAVEDVQAVIESDKNPAPVEVIDFSKFTVVQLRDECNNLGIAATGKKAELIKRIQDFQSTKDAVVLDKDGNDDNSEAMDGVVEQEEKRDDLEECNEDKENNDMLESQQEENISLSTENIEKEIAQKDSAKPKKEEKKRPAELEKYWKAVKNNSSDFTGWTYLLQYVEQENILEHACEAFDAFFERYPYCYGYWKKYGDLQRKHGNLNRGKEIYEEGVKNNPLSVDLWIHYINFTNSFVKVDDAEENEENLRSLYKRAVASCGLEFRSDKIWDQYVAWEKETKNLQNVYRLFEELIKIPTLSYSHHFENLKSFVQENHPKDFLDLDEFLRLREEVINEVELSDEATGDTVPGDPDGPPGEEAPPGLDTAGSKAETEKENKIIREKIIAKKQEVHSKTEEEVSKRWSFEEGIRRPYFHVKPLERAQLKNWKEYLDFEIEHGGYERVVVLFERCMIACALYEEFWIKYAKYLESHDVEKVRDIFTRACCVHLPKKPNVHITWAAFEERQGNTKKSIEIYDSLDKVLPGLAPLVMRRIGLLRRLKNHAEVERLFEESLEQSSDIMVSTFFSKKFARYLYKIMKNKARAMEVLLAATQKDKLNQKLYLQLLDMEYHSEDCTEHAVLEIFDMVLQKEEFPLEFRVHFSRRRLEYLEDFGCDVTKLLDAYEEHQKLMKDYKLEEKKKLAEQAEKHGSEDQGGSAAKKARYENGQAATAAASGYSGYSGWEGYSGYNYGNYYGSQYYQPS